MGEKSRLRARKQHLLLDGFHADGPSMIITKILLSVYPEFLLHTVPFIVFIETAKNLSSESVTLTTRIF